MKIFLSAFCILTVGASVFASQETPVFCSTSHSRYTPHGGTQIISTSKPAQLIDADGGASLSSAIIDSEEIRFEAFARENHIVITLLKKDSNSGHTQFSGILLADEEVKAEVAGPFSNQAEIYSVSCKLKK